MKKDLLLSRMKADVQSENISRARQSARIYGKLDLTQGPVYFSQFDQIKSTIIFKARTETLMLNGNRFGNADSRLCSMCNMQEEENVYHFIGTCPILREIRMQTFGKRNLSEQEVIEELDGRIDNWQRVVVFILNALKYRKELVAEFNY